jgi:hypothetical protein
MQEKYFELELRNNFLEIEKEKVTKLEATLRSHSRNEISEELIVQAGKMSTLKLQELKARRECATAQEKQSHAERLLEASKHQLEVL